ncbi:hypothetical protein H7R52_07050 [Weissella confusa]|uniref:Uncharacterized protein n=1 Tax=Weissella confusa TaxID=1583 RepID=A0A923NFI6_WEICO|nr:hypothetical protein [Weissella confusa]
MATQAQSQGRYAVINTLLDTTDVTLIDSLSGRQGDNGRIVYFAIKDGNLPHNLDGQNVVYNLNRLVDIFNEYHFVDMEGIQAKGHEYWGSNLSSFGESYDDFNGHLVAMENTLQNMVEIMILNGLSKVVK